MDETKDNELFPMIKDFLTIYLPMYRLCSSCTVLNYRIALDQYLSFLSKRDGIEYFDISFEMFSKSNIESYLLYLAKVKQLSAATRNARLAAISSFLRYAVGIDPKFLSHVIAVSTIKKAPIKQKINVDYLSENAVKALLNVPGQYTYIGRRDTMIFVLLYDTGARIQELMGLKLCDINFSSAPTARLFGKGSKVRTVPIMDSTLSLLKKYVHEFHYGEDLDSETPLFYTLRFGVKNKMSDDSVRLRLKHYADKARESCDEIPKRVYPHIFRHSRAMHLYQHGMDLEMISQWMGHSDIRVTLIYAYADTEFKRRAIANAMGKDFKLVDEAESMSELIRKKKMYGLK